MWLKRAVEAVNKVVVPITKWVDYVGVVIIFCMMMLTAVDVLLRYLFNKPILGSYELTELMMVVIIAFIVAYTLVGRHHVNVDLFVSRLPKGWQGILNIIGSLLGTAFFAGICWRSAVQGKILMAAGQHSATLYIPQYPFLYVISFGFGLIALVSFIQIFEYLFQVVEEWTH